MADMSQIQMRQWGGLQTIIDDVKALLALVGLLCYQMTMSDVDPKPVRKQYFSRPVGTDILIWDVHNLMRASQGLKVMMMPIAEIAEVDQNWWYGDGTEVPTPRSIAQHLALIHEVDPKHPIILSAEGWLMDGMHRIVKALAEGRTHIVAVRFAETPDPDFVNISLGDLPYPDEIV